MNRLVLIVGTRHVFQRPPVTRREEASQLIDLLVKFARKFGVRLVAEELAEEDLRGRDLVKSTCGDVAEFLCLPHVYCNSNEETRKRLCIPEGPLGYRAREAYWLEQLLLENTWPVLFVCGSLHVPWFKKLLACRSIEVKVLRRDWTPDLSRLSAENVIFGGKA